MTDAIPSRVQDAPSWLTDDWVRAYPARAVEFCAWFLDISRDEASEFVEKFLDD